MKVKVVSNTGINLYQKFVDDGWTAECKMELNINSIIIVYGISFFKNDVCYFLTCDKYNKPFWYPDEIFEIVDNKLSHLWYFMKYDETYDMRAIWGYNEIVNNENHHDNLMERELEDMKVFYKRKKQMDLEFPDYVIKEKANILDQNWVMCPFCTESREVNFFFAMLECPKCNKIMHNPLYKNQIN